MLVKFSETFLQLNYFSSFEIKNMIFVLEGAGSRERKLLKLDKILEKVRGQKSLIFTAKKKKKNSL